MHLKSSGFTLVELLVVMVIVGILSMIAIPNYMSSVRKSHRIDAQLTMQKIALSIERFYTMHGTIKTNNQGGNAGKTYTLEEHYGSACLPVTNNCDAGNTDIRYMFSLQLEPDFYVIQANPLHAQADDDCGVLTLDMTNTKTISNQKANVTLKDCW